MKKLLPAVCIFVFSIVAISARAQTAPGQAAARPAAAETLPPEIHLVTRELPNGLKLVMAEDHDAPVINLQMWYHVGSKDERPGRTGFAHLFEHLMYKGSAHVAPEEHSRIIEAMGGFDNAGTFDDVTVFWETFPSNYLERVLWLEADRMGSLKVDDANFKSEREVVKEERRTRVDNVPYGRVIEDLYAAAFTVHPYHHTTIGSMEDLDKATVGDVQEFFNAYYRPDNATVVIVGDFSAEDAAAWAQKYFGGIPKPSQPIQRPAKPEPPQTEERRLTKSYPNSPLPAIVIGYKTPGQFSADYYPLDLASNILSGGESSRLYKKLVYEDQIAVQTSGSGNFTEDPNLFFAIAVMAQGHSAAEGEKSIHGVLDQMKSLPVTDLELRKAKNQEVASFILARETVQSKADAIGRYAVVGKNPNLINTDLSTYLKITSADLQRVAQNYFTANRSTVLIVEPPPANPPAHPGESEHRQ
ncbi:MAG TPA: pitrilysin family protein [Candidatus Acidoferrales bacterium]|nr:pitrilysin family protein [Candidatus Acidoferrales bacterium]